MNIPTYPKVKVERNPNPIEGNPTLIFTTNLRILCNKDGKYYLMECRGVIVHPIKFNTLEAIEFCVRNLQLFHEESYRHSILVKVDLNLNDIIGMKGPIFVLDPDQRTEAERIKSI